MKRILQVVGKMNVGGAEQLLMNVYRNIDRTKYQFDFLTFYDEGEKGFFDDEIIELGGNIVNIDMPGINFIDNIKNVEAVLKKNKYDVVHTHLGNNSAFALVAAKKCGVPVRIAHSHNTPSTGISYARKVYDKLLSKIVNKNLTMCAACSEEAAIYRFSKFNRDNRYIYVPNSVDFSKYLENYDTEAIRKELNILENETMILQIGNLKLQKNQMFSVELMKQLKDLNCKLFFAGRNENDYGKQVKESVKLHGLDSNVIFLGQRSDIPELTSAADIMIMPSNWEGLGIVLLEAQAAGLPCVVSQAIQKEADLGVGLVTMCPLEDKQAWVDAIEKYKSYNRYSILERKEYLLKSDFSIEKTVNCFEKLYT